MNRLRHKTNKIKSGRPRCPYREAAAVSGASKYLDRNRVERWVSSGNRTDDKKKWEENIELWCHLYGQHSWHGPAQIEGTRAALTALRDAITTVLESGMDGKASLLAADGEGYQAEIRVRNYEYLLKRGLPYLAPYAGGIGADIMEREEESNRRVDEAVIWSVYYAFRADQQKT